MIIVEGQKGVGFCESCKKEGSITYRTEYFYTEYNESIPDVMQGFCDSCNLRAVLPPQSSHLVIPYYRKKVLDHNREKGLKMKCPICKTGLAVAGQERLETLDEHIMNREPSLKDAFGCPDTSCRANIGKIVWDSYGDMYSFSREEFFFIDSNYGPFESDRRSREACDIYKKTHTKEFKFKKVLLEIYPTCEADMNGKVLKKRWRFRIWINGVAYTSGVRMLIFSINSFYRNKKYRDLDYMKKSFVQFGRNDEWWRVASKWYCRIVHRKMYKSIFPDEVPNIKETIRKYA